MVHYGQQDTFSFDILVYFLLLGKCFPDNSNPKNQVVKAIQNILRKSADMFLKTSSRGSGQPAAFCLPGEAETAAEVRGGKHRS